MPERTPDSTRPVKRQYVIYSGKKILACDDLNTVFNFLVQEVSKDDEIIIEYRINGVLEYAWRVQQKKRRISNESVFEDPQHLQVG